jgi:hypothetical protein
MFSRVAEYASELATLLGRPDPVPLPAARAAMRDPRYRRFLIRAKDAPRLLDDLLCNPPEIETKGAGQEDAPPVPSTAKLAAHAAASLLAWSMQGFREVQADRYAQRIAACSTCPLVGQAPDRLDYRLASLGRDDTRICTACGCNIERKARLPHERCPAPSPIDGSKSRWNEPFQIIA